MESFSRSTGQCWHTAVSVRPLLHFWGWQVKKVTLAGRKVFFIQVLGPMPSPCFSHPTPLGLGPTCARGAPCACRAVQGCSVRGGWAHCSANRCVLLSSCSAGICKDRVLTSRSSTTTLGVINQQPNLV